METEFIGFMSGLLREVRDISYTAEKFLTIKAAIINNFVFTIDQMNMFNVKGDTQSANSE